MRYFSILILSTLGLSLAACNSGAKDSAKPAHTQTNQNWEGSGRAYFASGCFWCVEAIFESVEGVHEVISGYSGGKPGTATYTKVSAGITDHAESVEVIFDPDVVSYETLLEVFFGSHDPTTLNRQGPDRGRQYRSAIFYQNEQEKMAAEKYIAELKEKKVFDGEITTELSPLKAFYPAEDYHQDFEKKNPNQSYVRAVSVPRLNRFKQKFPELLKSGSGEH